GRARGAEGHAESELALALDDRVSHDRVEAEHGNQHAGNGIDAEEFGGDAGHLIAHAGRFFEGADVFDRKGSVEAGDGLTKLSGDSCGGGARTKRDDDVALVVLSEGQE